MALITHDVKCGTGARTTVRVQTGGVPGHVTLAIADQHGTKQAFIRWEDAVELKAALDSAMLEVVR